MTTTPEDKSDALELARDLLEMGNKAALAENTYRFPIFCTEHGPTIAQALLDTHAENERLREALWRIVDNVPLTLDATKSIAAEALSQPASTSDSK